MEEWPTGALGPTELDLLREGASRDRGVRPFGNVRDLRALLPSVAGVGAIRDTQGENRERYENETPRARPDPACTTRKVVPVRRTRYGDDVGAISATRYEGRGTRDEGRGTRDEGQCA